MTVEFSRLEYALCRGPFRHAWQPAREQRGVNGVPIPDVIGRGSRAEAVFKQVCAHGCGTARTYRVPLNGRAPKRSYDYEDGYRIEAGAASADIRVSAVMAIIAASGRARLRRVV